jgi:CheY-like chemotaxis protein
MLNKRKQMDYANKINITKSEKELVLDFKLEEENNVQDIASIVLNHEKAKELYDKLKKLFNEKQSISHLKILVVDDNIDYINKITKTLNNPNITFYTAPNGHIAVNEAKKIKPDIILMDHIMPVLNGLDASIKIKKYPDLKDTKIYLMMGFGRVTDLSNYLDTIFYKIIQKPTEINILKKDLSHLNFR